MSIPVEYLSILKKLADHFNVSDKDLIAGIEALRKDTDANSFPDKVFIDLLARMYLIVGDPSLSFEFGKLVGSDAYGFFGYAIRASKNLEQAIRFEEKYMPVVFETLKMKLNTIGKDKFSIGMEYDAPELFIPFLSEMVASSFVQAFSDLAGKKYRHRAKESFKEFELKLTYPAPDYVEVYDSYLPFKFSFNQPFNEIIGPQKLLYGKNRSYDPTLHKIMTDRLDTKFDESYSESFTDKVTKIIKENVLEDISLQQISEKLHMSERTLRRKLQQENTSFRIILLDTRMEESRSLIKKGDLSLEQISYMLGYQHASTFSNAFKKQYGISPKQYKDSLV